MVDVSSSGDLLHLRLFREGLRSGRLVVIVPYSMAPVVLSSFCGLFMLVPTEGISMAVLVFTVLVAAVAPAAAALSHHPEEHSTDENEPDNIFHGYPLSLAVLPFLLS
ncbi:MAG: hypothetical protein RX318_06670 [bacterium]|nr:hypothetical protein [bacterium]